jgi:hypothetical protein
LWHISEIWLKLFRRSEMGLIIGIKFTAYH